MNQFLANVPILYPLKTPEKVFWCFKGVQNENIGQKGVNWEYLSDSPKKRNCSMSAVETKPTYHTLTLSWQRSTSFKNHSTDLLSVMKKLSIISNSNQTLSALSYALPFNWIVSDQQTFHAFHFFKYVINYF